MTQTKCEHADDCAAMYQQAKSEHSALSAANAKIEVMRQELKDKTEALEFYAANSTWLTSKTENHAEHFGDLISVVDLEENSPITKRKFVGGKRARAILAKYPVGDGK